MKKGKYLRFFNYGFAAIYLLAFLISSTPSFGQEAAAQDKNYNVKLQIINANGEEVTSFMTKIASDRKTRSKGLMFIESLPKNHAMLFEFPKEDLHVMWMKNTNIPLDMIYINQNNEIVDIKYNTTPRSEEFLHPKYKVKRILEINGGLSQQLGINVGHRIKIN
ncbi:MAG: DUF192 domain-containing protein [Proteobacteria bacterium]|nr:DUF192 domain-containing protein [Pseudomonadota bacterium]